ncbi:MAG: hypothetical protein AB7G44_13745 [Bacteroidia bacterium]
MKTKTNLVLLKFLSVLLGLYFLNISINFYSFFGLLSPTVSVEIPETDNDQSAYLIQAGFDTGNSLTDTATDTSNNPPAEEEEEKKAAHDDCYTLHNRYSKLADESYLHRFHGINATREFISEIIPPPPKA